MTEAEWLACDDPAPMLEDLQAKASDRKLRLFAVACCRRIWDVLTDYRSQLAIEVAERFAEGEASGRELAEAWAAAGEVSPSGHGDAARNPSWHRTHTAAWRVAGVAAWVAALDTYRCAEGVAIVLIRDLFDNRFRPVMLGTGCRTRTVVSLAKAASEERIMPSRELDNARLGVLSDALEEAGCTYSDILGHLRSSGPHVRGCWALDLVLGKA
jgi:hypothetical protein